MKVRDIMTTNPARVAPDTLASTAIAELNARSITSLVVCDGDAPDPPAHRRCLEPASQAAATGPGKFFLRHIFSLPHG